MTRQRSAPRLPGIPSSSDHLNRCSPPRNTTVARPRSSCWIWAHRRTWRVRWASARSTSRPITTPVNVGELLIARGADVDPIGRQYDNTPLGGAMHCRSARMIALLSGYSRSAWEVGYAGNVDRLRELLTERPERARGYDGETLLMYVPPDDETKAIAVAHLLLEHGADPTIRDPQGLTAADRAERNAMYQLAALLREAETPA